MKNGKIHRAFPNHTDLQDCHNDTTSWHDSTACAPLWLDNHTCWKGLLGFHVGCWLDLGARSQKSIEKSTNPSRSKNPTAPCQTRPFGQVLVGTERFSREPWWFFLAGGLRSSVQSQSSTSYAVINFPCCSRSLHRAERITISGLLIWVLIILFNLSSSVYRSITKSCLTYLNEVPQGCFGHVPMLE